MYEQDLALNNLQCLISYKTQPNQIQSENPHFYIAILPIKCCNLLLNGLMFYILSYFSARTLKTLIL